MPKFTGTTEPNWEDDEGTLLKKIAQSVWENSPVNQWSLTNSPALVSTSSPAYVSSQVLKVEFRHVNGLERVQLRVIRVYHGV